MGRAHDPALSELAKELTLGALFDRLRADWGGYCLRAHWTQGEFHHDLVIELPGSVALPGPVLVVASNCNGGIKELLCFGELPEQGALWRWRCPDNDEFEGELPELLGRATTRHWFDPCELLLPDARSELSPEFRERQRGGGWKPKQRAVVAPKVVVPK